MSTPVHSYVTYIATSVEQVWTALTSGEMTKQYFFGRRIESDWGVGANVKYWQENGTLDVQGKILEFDPPKKLSFTWHVEWLEEYRKLPEVIVTFEIVDLGPVVRLTMTESHPTAIDPKYHEGGRRGWPVILSSLKSLLETGKALPKFENKF